jgi:hypothetical protein
MAAMPQNGNDHKNDGEMLHDIELYGDPGIASYDAKVPKFLLLTYFLLPIWGIATFFYFWNGSLGWFDRGYWHELQIAANTTFPVTNMNMVLEKKLLEEEKEPAEPAAEAAHEH